MGVKVAGDDELTPVEELGTLDGLYKFSASGIAANKAADEVSFVIVYEEGGEQWYVTANYSVVKYATKLFASTNSDESKALVAQAINYVNAAYTYAGTTAPEALTTLLASMSEMTFAALDNVAEIPAATTEVGTANVAIKSANLSLGTEFKFLLNLQADFTGELTLEYNGKAYTYQVENGAVGGATTVEVDMKACDLFDEVITISVNGEVAGTYGLVAYAKNITEGSGSNLADLLLNLYNYCREADQYAAYAYANGGLN